MKEILKSRKTLTGGWKIAAECQTLAELRAARDELNRLVRANERLREERWKKR